MPGALLTGRCSELPGPSEDRAASAGNDPPAAPGRGPHPFEVFGSCLACAVEGMRPLLLLLRVPESCSQGRGPVRHTQASLLSSVTSGTDWKWGWAENGRLCSEFWLP